MNISFISRRNYARNLAGTYGLSYREDAECKVPNASKRTITVPPYKYSFTKDEDAGWWCSFIHECYHHTHPEDFVFLESKQIKQRLPIVMYNNLVCDYKIERNNYGNMPGQDRLMDEGRAFGLAKAFKSFATPIEELLEKALADGDIKDAPEPQALAKMEDDRRKQEAVFLFDLEARKGWCPAVYPYYPEDASEAAKEYYERLRSSVGLLEQYRAVQTPEDQWEVARRFVNILEDDENAADEQEQQMQLGACSGEDEALEAAKKVLFKDIDFDKHEERATQVHADSDIDYTGYDERPEYSVRDPLILKYSDGSAQKVLVGGRDSYATAIRETDAGQSLSNAIAKHLLTLKKGRWEQGKTAGKISKRNVWKAKHLAGTANARRIHRKRVVQNDVNAAVSIVIDQSGSMSGQRYIHAAHSAIMLHNVLNRLQVPFEIVSFTDTGQPVNIVHKEFSTHVHTEGLLGQLCDASNMMSGNSDGESVMWAAERLLHRTEKKRIMIVLSDGQPSGTGGAGIDAFTQDVIAELERRIQIHGIGIMSNSVERYYTSNCVINSPDELEGALLSVLKTKILGV